MVPDLLRNADLALTTTLARIEPPRLMELIREDLRRHPDSKMGNIHQRIGKEINRSQVKRAMEELVRSGLVTQNGIRNGATYKLAAS